MGKNWYGIGMVLLVLAFIEVVFLNYPKSQTYGVIVGIWGLACMLMGLRAELKK
ncbi:MAG TPA: hypothetical protein VNN55_01960 [bacterium]|nr:hypothetical protein [bacterium]